jgi:hypothetical protein
VTEKVARRDRLNNPNFMGQLFLAREELQQAFSDAGQALRQDLDSEFGQKPQAAIDAIEAVHSEDAYHSAVTRELRDGAIGKWIAGQNDLVLLE